MKINMTETDVELFIDALDYYSHYLEKRHLNPAYGDNDYSSILNRIMETIDKLERIQRLEEGK